MIFVTEKDVTAVFVTNKKKKKKKKTLFVPEKDVTIMGNDVTITL